jgi:two-component system KDP operon response regulator KdpE
MEQARQAEKCQGLPPLVGTRLVIVSTGLERSYDRARGLDDMGYRVGACGDPRTAAGFVAEFSPDAVILDMGRDLPSAADIVARIREASNAVMVVVGGSPAPSDMLRCYEAGADEFCRPPVSTEELDLRLRALFRRLRIVGTNMAVSPSPSVLRIGELEIDPAAQVVRKRGQVIPLSPTEFRLLITLAERCGEVVPSKALIARVWGNQYASETHYLRLYVRYLRQKLEDDPSHPSYIVNRWGSGYALEEPAKAA